jgi:predicted dehydrogenase
MDRVAIGLIGCGFMGQRHLRAYGALADAGSKAFDVAAVCDARPDVAADAADLAESLVGRRPAVFSEYAEMLKAGVVEAVDLVTDPASHHRLAVPALEAGVHVSCEKPLGITVRACREIIDAIKPGTVLSTAENYRRDGPNRLARRVLDVGLLGHLHGMVETHIGGSDGVLISPWRSILESGSMALDMGVHFLDIFNYFLGDIETAYGRSYVAEPLRRMAADAPAVPGIEYVEPGVFKATGDEAVVAFFESTAGKSVQLTYIPSGPGPRYRQRSLHGRNGSMEVPGDRTGGPVVVHLGDTELSGAALREAVGGFALDGVSAAFFGAEGTEYDRPFAYTDAALIGIELDDFATAIRTGGPPEVGGAGGLAAVAGVWAVAESQLLGRAVGIEEIASGALGAAQEPVDRHLGLIS